MITIELIESEEVVSRGVRRVRWRVAHGAGFADASRFPGARVELLPSAPGVAWQRRIELQLPVGAKLQREQSEPLEQRPRGVLAHLEGGRRAAQRVVKTSFVVTQTGRLERRDG